MKKTISLLLALLILALPAQALAASTTSTCKTYNCSTGICVKNKACASKCTGSSCSGAKVNNTAAQNGTNMSQMASSVVSQTNAERAKQGLNALKVDADLTAAACVRAKEIVQQFSHTRPSGKSALTVSAKAKGENIAKGQQSADKVMAAWMTSSGHKANILRKSYKSIGVCAYKVNGIMYWVQLFGN